MGRAGDGACRFSGFRAKSVGSHRFAVDGRAGAGSGPYEKKGEAGEFRQKTGRACNA